MGGKTWSFEEERFFWHGIVPQSPKGVSPVDRVLDWDMCARRMQTAMGDKARRKYTKLMLFEHYFQNVSTGHMSPHALAFVNEHKSQLTAELESSIKKKARESANGNDTDGDQSHSGTVNDMDELPARQVATVKDSPSAWSLPPTRDHTQLPRLDIPSYQSQQPVYPCSDSPTGCGSYNPSPTTELPNTWACHPRLMLQSQSFSDEYGTASDYSAYGFGRAPVASMMSAELSPISSSFRSMPSPTLPLTSTELLVSNRVNKRKVDEMVGYETYSYTPKRNGFYSQTYPLDTLAAAASMDYQPRSGGPAIPLPEATNNSGGFLPANDNCYASTPAMTPPESGEISPVHTSQLPSEQGRPAQAGCDWGF